MKKKICVWLLSTVLVAEIIGTCGGNAVNVLAALSGSTLENELEQYDQEAERQLNDEEDESGDDQRTVGVFGRQSGKDFVTGWLVCTKGSEKGRDYRIYNGNNWIGRGYQMDICIVDDPSISRERHAVLVYDYKSNKFFLSPGCGTITMVNQEILTKAKELKSRDRITLGKSEFTFVPFCVEGETWEREEK